jgi:Flp pilus assembly protein TadG
MIGRRFRQCEAGNYATMFALLLPVLLGSVAFAVDIGSMQRAHSKLQDALDAATLAASRIHDKDVDREKVFRDFLDANIASDPVLKNVTAYLTVETGINYISTKGTATATIDLFFPIAFGPSRDIAAEATAYESRDNLEVVLALDNTGSMGSARMSELRKAASSLVDILSTVHSPSAEPKRVVKAALVPFVTAVNIKGEGYKASWIDNYYDPKLQLNRAYGSDYHGVNFEQQSLTVNGKTVKDNYSHIELFKRLNVDWKGCVEARPAPYNLNDDAPTTSRPDTLFVPYFAPDNPGNARQSPNSGDWWNNSYLDDKFTSATAANAKTVARYLDPSVTRYIRETSSRTTGPNYACPTPIVPLTSDFTKLKSEISKMIYWEGSGTNVSEGLAWSMRVLSPAEPYTQGAPFRSENTSKFVVVFTDGENTVFGAQNEAFNSSDYGSYGFLDQGRVGTTNRGAALTKVNDFTLDACANLKAQGVEVFTVLLGADTQANRTLYSRCASIPENYYPTSDVSQLDTVFRKIASRIAKLYVTG